MHNRNDFSNYLGMYIIAWTISRAVTRTLIWGCTFILVGQNMNISTPPPINALVYGPDY